MRRLPGISSPSISRRISLCRRGIEAAWRRSTKRWSSRLTSLTVEAMYATSEENKFIEVTYANGEKEVLYFKDFASGALIEGIVSRAKKFAVKRAIAKKGPACARRT